MISFTTSWCRKFVLLIVAVCLCWNRSFASEKALEQQQEQATPPTLGEINSTATTREPQENELEFERTGQTEGILNLGCQGIRIRRYVSNGFCTSSRPFRDTICDGQCLPMDQLPLFPEFSKIISRHKREWRCVADTVRTKKVTVFCNDGTKRKYRVRIVRSCKCKRYTDKQNQTNP